MKEVKQQDGGGTANNMIDEDIDVWYKYPQYHNMCNKLWLSEKLGYKCGPAGIPVPEDDWYIIRPTYNLAGMGVGAKRVRLSPDDWDKGIVPAGYFWCEWFEGEHLSIDYVRSKKSPKGSIFWWEFQRAYIGEKLPLKPFEFGSWKRTEIDKGYRLPDWFRSIEADALNVEMIGGNIIEIHLRQGFDHMDQYNVIYPVFEYNCMMSPTMGPATVLGKPGFKYIDGPATGYGALKNKRLGYWVK